MQAAAMKLLIIRVDVVMYFVAMHRPAANVVARRVQLRQKAHCVLLGRTLTRGRNAKLCHGFTVFFYPFRRSIFVDFCDGFADAFLTFFCRPDYPDAPGFILVDIRISVTFSLPVDVDALPPARRRSAPFLYAYARHSTTLLSAAADCQDLTCALRSG